MYYASRLFVFAKLISVYYASVTLAAWLTHTVALVALTLADVQGIVNKHKIVIPVYSLDRYRVGIGTQRG